MSGNVKFDKWINDDNSENYKCRAWVNFDGTGTVAIRASGNVSSITDNGTGDYTVNFTTAMADANYAGVGSSVGSTTAWAGTTYFTGNTLNVAATPSAFRFGLRDAYNSQNPIDMNNICVSIYR